eukprot:717208-Pleurochrysis_carterae.AAC.2
MKKRHLVMSPQIVSRVDVSELVEDHQEKLSSTRDISFNEISQYPTDTAHTESSTKGTNTFIMRASEAPHRAAATRRRRRQHHSSHLSMVSAVAAVSVLLVALACAVHSARGIVWRVWQMFHEMDHSRPASSNRKSPVRMGLLGCASVSPFALMLPARRVPDRAQVVAVAARDLQRARDFAKQWNVPRAGSYDQMLADPDVEAVYIPLLNGLHYEWAAAALRAKKHVLLEKPFTSNAEEVFILLAATYHNSCVGQITP